MSELVIIRKSTLDGIGDAVRERKGTTALIPTLQLRPEILSISGEDNPIIATTETEMESLITDDNIGKVIRYDGESGKYANGELYIVSNDTTTEQYYTLPDVNNPATSNDILAGKEAVGKNGELIIGAFVIPEPAEDLDAELNEQDELLSDLATKINEMANLEPEGTPNLVYTLSADGTYYIVGTGFTSIEAIEADASGGNNGSGLDENWRGGRVVIPRLHNDKPVLAIAPRAFLDILNITSVYIFDGLTHIGHRCFQCTGNYGYDVTMNAIRFPNTLKKLGCGNGRVLWGRQGLTSVTLPNNVTDLENSTFAYCNGLDCLSAPMVTYASNSPMQNSPNITKVYLPNLEESLSNLCRDCESLTSIHLPKIKILGGSAFSGCIALQTISLGADIENIGAYVFNCGSSDKKTTIIIEATTPPALDAGAFNTSNYLTTIAKIVVPKGCGNAYKTATNWTLVASIIEEAA